jgi:peroxiredoxin
MDDAPQPRSSSDKTDVAPSAEILARAAAAARHAVRAGRYAPTFRLEDLHGGSVALVDLIAGGPLVISFYRGIWCDYCHLALEALARSDEEIRATGATQVAIGPPPDGNDQRRRLQAFPMPVLVDRGLRVSSAYGLAIALPDAMREQYIEAGYVPLTSSNSGTWLVPIPATYVVERTGRVAVAAIDSDYRSRLEPTELLSALRGLQQRIAG